MDRRGAPVEAKVSADPELGPTRRGILTISRETYQGFA